MEYLVVIFPRRDQSKAFLSQETLLTEDFNSFCKTLIIPISVKLLLIKNVFRPTFSMVIGRRRIRFAAEVPHDKGYRSYLKDPVERHRENDPQGSGISSGCCVAAIVLYLDYS